MTNIIDDTYAVSNWDGSDWSMGQLRSDRDNGGIRVGWNRPDGANHEIIVTVADCFREDKISTVVLNKATAVEVLNHLNTLLGNPLSYAPMAGA